MPGRYEEVVDELSLLQQAGSRSTDMTYPRKHWASRHVSCVADSMMNADLSSTISMDSSKPPLSSALRFSHNDFDEVFKINSLSHVDKTDIYMQKGL